MIKDCIIFQTSYLLTDDVYELSKEELDIINSEKTLMQGIKKFVNKPVVISKPGRYFSIIYDKTIGLFYYTSGKNQRTYIIPDTSYVYNVVKPFIAGYYLDVLDHIAKVILDRESGSNTFYESTNKEAWKGTSWTDEVDGKKITVTIEDMLDVIKDNPIKEIKTKILEPYGIHKTKTDKETLDNIQKANLEYPIIVLHHPNKYQILDGHHRLQKAINNNIPTIKARVIELSDLPEDWQKIFR